MMMSTEALGETLLLTPPDTEVMNAARQHILTQVTALKLDFLPVMKEKMLPLQAALNRADKVYRDVLAAVTVELNKVNLQQIDLKQQQIEADKRLSDAQKQQAISLLDKHRIRELSSLTTAINSGAQAIAASSDNMLQIDLKLKDRRLLETLQQQIDTMTQRKATLDSTMSTIAEDRRLLDATIKTFEQHNLADIFKDLLPTPDELALISLSSPEIELIKAGIARLGKLLDKLSSALTYLDLTKERDRLRMRYNALLEESRTAMQEAKAIAGKLDELNELDGVNQSKTLWVQEAKKVYESLYSFLDNVTLQEESSASISKHVEQLKAYIKSFYTTSRIV
ncbi:alpha-xenorhabdolysin family binary toxin subunit B [Pseudomonas syringae]|uniref:alpha-xenorhabdolysin family binary toxin subunit B n=1 Tax=Pseudomonas syringae TaxID=317 RepID=UPI000736D6FF|nr:alpha-xenorhabdolysin family binary toxin subunit B [Pseudomonas syringae]KTB82344.1 toxin [Pseudomonas syringae pv. syringae PD2766]